VMGLEPTESGSKRTFSNDVLRLEISGPKEDHLSVIDVPGIFKRHTSGVTTKADMEMVGRMVHNYMKNPRSVMLTVVPANVDVATQEILEKAEEVDTDGVRTLGVLTKPDPVDKGAEKDVMDLIEGRKHELRLGWHVLRNAGQAELGNPVADRDAKERCFFAEESPWDSLDKERVGINSFRERLQEILAGHIRREFPKVRSPTGSTNPHNLKNASGEVRDYQETPYMPPEFASSWGKTSNIGRTESIFNGDCDGISEAIRRSVVVQLRTRRRLRQKPNAPARDRCSQPQRSHVGSYGNEWAYIPFRIQRYGKRSRSRL